MTSPIDQETYLSQQRERFKANLNAANSRVQAAQANVDKFYPPTEQAAARVQELVREAAQDARRTAIKQGYKTSWLAAISLSAFNPPGTRWVQIGLWIGLLLLNYYLSWAFLFPYALLAWWGLNIEAKRRTRDFCYGLNLLASLEPRFMHFSVHESDDPKYPYVATRAPWPGRDINQNWNINEVYGKQLFETNFISFNKDNSISQPIFLLLLDNQSEKTKLIPINDCPASYSESWQSLLKLLAPRLLPLASSICELAVHAEELAQANSDVALLQQRLKTSDQNISDWDDVAVNARTLDQILKLVDLFVSGRKPAPKGLLLYGPPGTGKTLIARQLAKHSDCNFEAVGIADLKGRYVGETGPRVKELWQRCRQKSPCILFVDECESAFAIRRGIDSDSFGNELVETFLAEWDGFKQTPGKVLLIGATNHRDILDNAMMSRFTTSIEIGLPDADCRRRIIQSELRHAGLNNITVYDGMVQETSGMSGRDIHTLVVRIVAEHLDHELTSEDFVAQVREFRGKNSTQVKPLDWKDIVLPKDILEEFVSLGQELRNAEQLRALNIPVPRGILLYGPPGTGKTQIARVLAGQSGLSFLAASTADMKGNFIGQSGNKVKALFEKARAQAPCILFIDEIDIVAPARGDGRSSDTYTNEIVGQLLQELDGVATQSGQIFLLAASNHPSSVDSALLSRLERKIEIGLPDADGRAAIVALQLREKPVDFDIDKTAQWLAKRTEGLSGRGLESLITKATTRALRRALADGDPLSVRVERTDLEHALTESAASS